MMDRFELFADMARYIGKTVTIFTTSGGISGSGFTGVLASVDDRVVRLITRIGAGPACPLGPIQNGCCNTGGGCGGNWGWGGGNWGGGWNSWGGGWNSWGGGSGCGCGGSWGGGWDAGNLTGAVSVIPIHAIASFTHNAI